MQYLKYSYLFMLDRDTDSTYSHCCKKAIQHMRENCGVNIINNHKILMRWNRIFRLDEVFPHPNSNIQHGNTYHSDFLDAFPETKILICQWANKNLDKLCCENIGIFIRNDIVPKIYKTYLEDNSDSEHEPLSQQEFLALFGLKKISNTTIWKWMKHFGFTYDERKKSYFSDKHEDEENVTSRKNLPRHIFVWKSVRTDGSKSMKF